VTCTSPAKVQGRQHLVTVWHLLLYVPQGLTALSEHAEHEAVSTPGAPDKGATDTDSDKAQRSAGSHPGQVCTGVLFVHKQNMWG
jgi:hypothetical protein